MSENGNGRVRFRGGQRQDVASGERMRQALRLGQYAVTTEKIYVRWVERYVAFHRGRRAEEMGAAEVEQFLTHLATDREVSAGTQKQTLSALVMLYETVLGKKLGQLMPIRGHHLHVDSLRRAVKDAVRVTGLTKQITPHTFRHSFATRLLETGTNIKQVQDLMGHKDIRTTMIYLHMMESGTTDVMSPLEMLEL